MIEATINGWILTLGKDDKYVYIDKQVDDYLLEHHFDELEPYLIKRDVYFGGCVETNLVGIETERFFFLEPDKFTIIFMLGHKTNFL
jgi:hypothetical protein